MVQWSEFMTTDYEVPGSFPVLTWGFILAVEDFHGDHSLGSLVEIMFNALYFTIQVIETTSLLSKLQKSFTLRPQLGEEATKSISDMW
jgi:hypothetical protein